MTRMLRHSARLLFKSPGAAVAAIASLALGIAANTSIFSLIDAVVLRPLPVSEPARVVAVTARREFTLSYPAYLDFVAGSRSFSGLAAHARRQGAVTIGDSTTVGEVQVVSGNYFGVLGVVPSHGRALLPSDDEKGAEPVVVISSSFWQQAFGSSPAIGRSILINGSPFPIVGIAPAGFKGIDLGAAPLAWIAINSWPRVATGNYLRLSLDHRGWGWLRLVGRLRDGAREEQAHTELNRLAARQERDFPRHTPTGFEVSLTPISAAATGLRSRADLTRFVALLALVVLAVLGIACANVAGLLLARAVSRRREMAIRVALGARRGRIAAELLVDSLLLASAAGVVGVLMTMWALDLLQKIQLPGGIDMSRVDVRISGAALLATVAITAVAAVLSGLAPALQSTGADLVGGLKDQPLTGRAGRQRLRAALVAAQVTFSLVLLVGTGLFARALQTALTGDLGFNPRDVVYAATNMGLQRYDAARASGFYADVLARVRSLPGIRAAGWTVLIPSDSRDTESVQIPGYVSPTGRNPLVGVNAVTSGYFEAMGIRIVRGRAFTDRDTADSPRVVVVSEAAAARFWNGNALGRPFTISDMQVTVVGVARDVPPQPGAPPQPFVYGNLMQLRNAGLSVMHLVARTEGDPATIVPRLRIAIREASSTAPILEARPLEEQLMDLFGAQRSAASLMGLLSIVALVLSIAGIYAMVSFWVNQRTREFGVRMALGASRGTIRTLALKHAAVAVIAGILIGVPAAVALGRASRGLLFGLSPVDPLSFGAAIALLAVTAVAGSLIPAHRAATTNPLEALRAGTE